MGLTRIDNEAEQRASLERMTRQIEWVMWPVVLLVLFTMLLWEALLWGRVRVISGLLFWLYERVG